jgi:hypothetical protein
VTKLDNVTELELEEDGNAEEEPDEELGVD